MFAFASWACNGCRGCKGAWNLLELELQTAVSFHMHTCQESSLGPLQEQSALSTSEPPLWPLNIVLTMLAGFTMLAIEVGSHACSYLNVQYERQSVGYSHDFHPLQRRMTTVYSFQLPIFLSQLVLRQPK